MKRLLLIFSILGIVCACNADVMGTLYDEDNLGSGFSFAGTVLNAETAAEDEGIVRIPVYRGKTASDQAHITCEFYDADTEKWTSSDPKGLFRLATSRVIFIDGAITAYAQVSYSSLEALGLTEKHSFRLRIEDEVSPGGNSTCNVTLNRRLTFKSLGTGKIHDEFFSDGDTWFDVEILRADEAEVYRVMHPFEQILIAEGFQDIGWATTPDEYLQIEVRQNGTVRYDEFRNGMYLQKQFIIYGVYAPERKEHLDVDLSKFTNTRLDEKTFELYPFYYIKNYGYLADPYKMLITLP